MTSGGGGPRLLEEAIPGEISFVSFFNGRLLTGEDLSREQDANRESRLRLGVGLGDGVVQGLHVTESLEESKPNKPVVKVTSGLAVNRRGAAIELALDTDVSLVRMGSRLAPASGSAAPPSGDFRDCGALVPGAYFTESGVYLLTISTAEQTKGRAPVSGLGNSVASCNSDVSVEGVKFQLIHLDVSKTVLGNLLADPLRLRNRLAHLMFGTEDPRRKAVVADPFGSTLPTYGFLDDLRPNCLTDDQVSLALLYWTPGTGIAFIDMWSVRRRVTRRTSTDDFATILSDRRRSEGEAMLLQFQEHLEGLRRATSGPEKLAAKAAFDYLPPIGFLPVVGSPSFRAFDFHEFFAGVPSRGPAIVEGTHLAGLAEESLTYSPIRLAAGEAAWLYEVRENLQRAAPGSAPPAVTYLVFSTGHIRYRADARFELAYWNYSSFGRLG